MRQRAWGERLGSVIGLVLGWFLCMAMVAGMYALGYWIAPHFGGAEDRDTFGVLAVIATIWMYEHELADDRWGRLFAREP